MAAKGRSATFARLFGQTGIGGTSSLATVGDGFDSAFAVLKTAGLRDEYIYRAAVTHKVLMGKHSLSTACMLTEFRAGSCKADLVILNGTASAFEIKSERDSLSRLSNQIANYEKVFATVNVIVSDIHVSSVLETMPEYIGVMCLSKRYRISTVRDATDHPGRICPITVFESLRSSEARAILEALGTPVPDLPNTMRHSAMRKLFATLRPADVHYAMVSTLKRSRSLAPLSDLIDRIPSSLHAAALSIQIPRSKHDHLVKAVSTPLADAMSWA